MIAERLPDPVDGLCFGRPSSRVAPGERRTRWLGVVFALLLHAVLYLGWRDLTRPHGSTPSVASLQVLLLDRPAAAPPPSPPPPATRPQPSAAAPAPAPAPAAASTATPQQLPPAPAASAARVDNPADLAAGALPLQPPPLDDSAGTPSFAPPASATIRGRRLDARPPPAALPGEASNPAAPDVGSFRYRPTPEEVTYATFSALLGRSRPDTCALMKRRAVNEQDETVRSYDLAKIQRYCSD